ncbi:hypothetical protein MZA99_03695 [Haemophilus influenzae]
MGTTTQQQPHCQKCHTWRWLPVNVIKPQKMGINFDRTLLPFDESCYTPLQLELFATNPVDFEFIEQKLENLPRQRQREYFP